MCKLFALIGNKEYELKTKKKVKIRYCILRVLADIPNEIVINPIFILKKLAELLIRIEEI